MKTITKTCPKCGTEFQANISGYQKKFCSRSCANSNTNSGPKKGANPLQKIWEHSKVIFKNCKKCKAPMVLSNLKPGRSPYNWYCENCIGSDKKIYRKQCRFNLSPKKHPELYDFDLISKYGWYQPNSAKKPNTKGVTWDHLYQIQEGFQNNISPEIISHPANAELVSFEENYQRRRRSMITLEQLYERIKLWDSGTRELEKNW